MENDLRDLNAGDDSLLLAQQAHAAMFVGGDARERRVVAVADVLFDAKLDKSVYEWFVFCLHIVTVFDAKLQKNRSLVHGFVVERLVAHGNLRVAAGEDHLQAAVGEPAPVNIGIANPLPVCGS